MPIDIRRPNPPVLVLFNLDPDWLAGEQEEVLDITSQLEQALMSLGYQTTLVPVTDNNLDLLLTGYDPLNYVVFNWCESIPGLPHSEWLVAEYLEQRGFTFTGAGSSAIRLAHNKIRVKWLLDEARIPTPEWRPFDSGSGSGWDRFPAIVKPSREHCSEGIDRNSVVTTTTEMESRIEYIRQKFQQPVIVEDFIDGRELHVTLWGNGEIEMLPPAEMEFSLFQDQHDHICSYEAKFVPESEPYQKIKTVLPAVLTEKELRDVAEVCKAVYLATGCRDYSRIDMRLRGGYPYVIDINPNSDISPDTSTISAAELTGYSYGEFIAHIIKLAARRHPIFSKMSGIRDSEITTR